MDNANKIKLLGEEEKKSDSLLNNFIIFIMVFLIIFFSSLVIVESFWLAPLEIIGSSMEQTMSSGEVLIMDRISKYDYGDIVVVKIDGSTNYIKRIIGKPGDTIYSDAQGKVHRITNGVDTVLDEPYAYYDSKMGEGTFIINTKAPIPKRTLKEGEIFVLGDNRWHSSDSRTIPKLTEDSIIGVVPDWVFENPRLKNEILSLFRILETISDFFKDITKIFNK